AKEFKEFKAGGVMGVAVRATSDVLKLEMQNETESRNGTICDLTASTEALCRIIDGLVIAPWMPRVGNFQVWSGLLHKKFARGKPYYETLLAAAEKLWSCNIESTRLHLKDPKCLKDLKDLKDKFVSKAGLFAMLRIQERVRLKYPEVKSAKKTLDEKVFPALVLPELVLNGSTIFAVMEGRMTSDECPALSELDTLRALMGEAVPVKYRGAFLQGGGDLLAKAGAYAVTTLASPIFDTPFGFFLKMVMGVHYLHSLLQDMGCSELYKKPSGHLGLKQKPNSTKVSAFSMRTQNVDYTPNHEIKKITSSENKISYRCYYSAKGVNTFALDLAKDLYAFPAELDELPAELDKLLALSCPDIPAEAAPPLMAEYQCDAHGNPLGLILYGYRTVKRNERQV
ncbi:MULTISPECIES: hypothetical protein, partial [unclassified Pseudomonas]|uniref:hypothetical protein n=1 Tax=unclassified Pseudomonas TaxID=196821 RepID=UPI000BC58C77